MTEIFYMLTEDMFVIKDAEFAALKQCKETSLELIKSCFGITPVFL